MDCTEDKIEIFQDETKFYNDSAIFWSQVPATVDGVLGGFGCISLADIKGSDAFLKKLFAVKDHKLSHGRALDCGAGIGRITKNLLVHHFKKVDLVDQNPKFMEAARKLLSLEANLGELFCSGLQGFIPTPGHYDLIWCQWVLGYLTNDDMVQFLLRCKAGLTKTGLIVIKENMAVCDVVEDDEDSSVTRPLTLYLNLFKKAGFEVLQQSKQANFPKQLFKVMIFALKPIEVPSECGVLQITNLVSNEITNP